MRKGYVQLFAGNVLGKVIGLFREGLMAALFGVGMVVGSYRVAQTATLIPVNFFTADALNAGFVPLYRRFAHDCQEQADALFWLLTALLSVLSFVLCVGLFVGAGVWVRFLTPGFDAESRWMTIELLRVTALGIPFYVLASMIMYMEMANNSYTLASLRPTIQSIGLIVGTLLAFLLKEPVFLAWGFTIAYTLFFLIGVFRTTKLRLLRWVDWSLIQKMEIFRCFWENIRVLLPLPFMLQGHIAVERMIASLFGVGVIAALDYAKVVIETAALFISVPLGTVAVAVYSQLSKEEMNRRLNNLIPLLLAAGFSLSAFIGLNATPIVRLLYERGSFDAAAVNSTAKILIGLSFGFWGHIFSYVIIKVLNSQLRNKEVLGAMFIALLVNIVSNFLLFPVLGPIALGIGSSLYGIVLSIISAIYIGVARQFLQYSAWLGLGVAGYAALSIIVSSFSSGLFHLFLIAVVFTLYWGTYFFGIKHFRATIFYPALKIISNRDFLG